MHFLRIGLNKLKSSSLSPNVDLLVLVFPKGVFVHHSYLHCTQMNIGVTIRGTLLLNFQMTAILARLYKDEDLQRYTTEIADFVLWSKEHSLVINVCKTEEIIFDYRSVGNHSPIIINNEPVRQVASYKYLG